MDFWIAAVGFSCVCVFAFLFLVFLFCVVDEREAKVVQESLLFDFLKHDERPSVR